VEILVYLEINMLLLDLMSHQELEESIQLLKQKLFETASTRGFSDKRAGEIRQTLALYLSRYDKLKCTKWKTS
jgi:hypothetical protein